MQQDTGHALDPLVNRDKISDQPIMNVEINKEENSNINHKAKHITKLTQEWIKNPFKLDPIHETIIFHAQAHPAKGRDHLPYIYSLVTNKAKNGAPT